MSKSRYLLEQHTVSELFTLVYVLVDDYLKVGVQQGRFVLPESPQQKGSYSELMTIALVGDLLNQADVGLWFNLVKREYRSLFPTLPDDSRYYRVLMNLERVWADLALALEAMWLAEEAAGRPMAVTIGRFHTPAERHSLTMVSGRFELSLDLRAYSASHLQSLEAKLGAIVAQVAARRGVRIELGERSAAAPGPACSSGTAGIASPRRYRSASPSPMSSAPTCTLAPTRRRALSSTPPTMRPTSGRRMPLAAGRGPATSRR